LLEKSNNRVDDAVNRFYDDPLADFGFAVAPAAVKKRPRFFAFAVFEYRFRMF